MNKRCQACNSCSMPFVGQEEVCKNAPDYCSYCVHEDGTLKSFEMILAGTAQHLADSQGIALPIAHKMAEDMLKSLPAWQNRGGV